MKFAFSLHSNPAINNMVGAYANQPFIVQPNDSWRRLVITQLIFLFKTTDALDTGFGDLVSPLTNGIKICTQKRHPTENVWALNQDYTPLPIKSNLDFLYYGQEFKTVKNKAGSHVIAVQAIIDFEEAILVAYDHRKNFVSGSPIDRLAVIAGDNLTGSATSIQVIAEGLIQSD